jgi:hypothetical protein
MGMFDTITCKYPLPRPDNPMELKDFNFNSTSFQTKDLENGLDNYEIREDGSLWIRRTESERVEGDKKAKSFIDRFGHMKLIKEWWEPTKFTGVIEFYNSIGFDGEVDRDSYEKDYWVEFIATFVDGQITTVGLLKFEGTNNAERKKRDAEWKEKIRLEKILWDKWYMKYLYRHYDNAVNWIFRKWNRLSQSLPPSYRIERFFRPL